MATETPEPWEHAVFAALSATGRPYIVVIVDHPIAAGESAVFASGPALVTRSNLVSDSAIYVLERVLSNMKRDREESRGNDTVKRSSN